LNRWERIYSITSPKLTINSDVKPVSGLRVPFGERGGQMFPPEKVARGLDCECICPGCGNRLIANQGPRKRAYFSHYRSPECSGGYESALHKMAKQIILEASWVTLPSHSVTVKVPLIDGTSLLDDVSFERRPCQFRSVCLEHSVERWWADLRATLKNDASLHIEIAVTHFVDEDKSAGMDNMMEIDLSHVSYETARDIDSLRQTVLETAPRQWHRVSLYDDLSRVKAKQRQLEAKTAAHNDSIRIRLERERQRQRRESLEVERQRHEYAQHIDILNRMRDPDAQKRLRDERWQQWHETIASNISTLSGFCSVFDLPADCVGVALEGDWIVPAHPAVWQFYLLKILSQHPRSRDIYISEGVQVIKTAFGFEPAVETLVNAAPRYAGKPHRSTSTEGPNFLTPEERDALITPKRLVKRFLETLVTCGFLETSSSLGDFKIADKARKEERQQQKQLKEKREAELQEQIYSPQHRRYCENMLESLLLQRASTASECLRCWALTTSRGSCPRCQGGALADVELNEVFVERYRQKLDTLPR